MLDADEAFAQVHATRIAGALRKPRGRHAPSRAAGARPRAHRRALGGTIYENSEVLRVVPGADAALGDRARHAARAPRESSPRARPISRNSSNSGARCCDVVDDRAHRAADAAQWEAVGWEDGASLSSQVRTKNYLTRTRDGRILFGSRGARYLYGSRMPEAALREDEATFAWMRQCVADWWPALDEVEFTHAWGGYLGVPRDWLPTAHFDADARLAQLHGYTGRGVSTSAMCAQLLAGLIGGWRTGLEDLPSTAAAPRLWEPEPFRWMGVRYIQDAFARIDEADEGHRALPIDTRLAEALGEP
ncbi:MAG: FAD-dependent oxidoreductase [Sphingomonas sp.]